MCTGDWARRVDKEREGHQCCEAPDQSWNYRAGRKGTVICYLSVF
jgi:hypothetical protein